MKKIIKSALALLLSLVVFGFSACKINNGDLDGGGSGAGTEQGGGSSGGGNGGDNGGTNGGNNGGDEGSGGSSDDNGGNSGGSSDDNGGDEGSGGDEGNSGDSQPQTPVFPEPEPETPEATPTAVGQKNMISALKNSQYRSAVSNSTLGLTDASKVGADQRAFSRVLYPAPIAGVKTYEVEDYGVSPTGENNTRDLNALLASLKDEAGTKVVKFGKGTYTFKTTIELKNLKNVYLVGDETNFVYSTWCNAVHVKDSENIHVNGISVDFDPSPVVAGSIKSCDTSAKKITIQLDSEFSLSDARYNGGKIRYGSYMEFHEDDYGTLYPNASGNLLYNSTGDQVQNITAGAYNASMNELTLTFKSIKAAAAGTRVSVAFTMYEFPAYNVEDSKNFYMEGCNLYSAAGMGIKLDSVENAYLNRTNIMLKNGSSRLMTVTADGLHAKDCFGDLQLTGSIFENSHDDSINVASFYKEVTAVGRKDRTLTCEAASTQSNYPFEVGNVLEVYDPSTFALCGTYKVMAVDASALTTVVTVDKKVSDDLVGKIIGNVTRSAKVKVNDNIFRNKRNRGILLQTRNSEISGNTFQNIVHGPISIHSIMDIFAEALLPKNVTISNNKFINNNDGYGLSGDVAVFAGSGSSGVANAIQGITVTNNFFYSSARAGIFFTASGSSTIANNLLCSTGRVSGEKYSMYVGISENITIKENCVVRTANGEFSIYKHVNATINDSNNLLQILGGI